MRAEVADLGRACVCELEGIGEREREGERECKREGERECEREDEGEGARKCECEGCLGDIGCPREAADPAAAHCLIQPRAAV